MTEALYKKIVTGLIVMVFMMLVTEVTYDVTEVCMSWFDSSEVLIVLSDPCLLEDHLLFGTRSQ